MRVALLALVVLASTSASARAQDVPASYAEASDVRVHFETEQLGLSLLRADGHGGWTPLGVAPCELVLPHGAIQFALAYENHDPTRVPVVLELLDGAHLVAHYESRQLLRELGVGILLGTMAMVLVGIAIGVGGFVGGSVDVGIGGLVAGAAVGVVGGATGVTLATLDDIATIDVL